MGTKTGVVAGGGAGAALASIALGLATPTITTAEGQRTIAYKDLVGVLTVCNGHTGKDIVVGRVYTPSDCQALTKADATKAMNGVLVYSPELVWHPMQLASAISFSYNLGVGTYEKSTVRTLFDTGEFVAACNFMPHYVYAGGKVIPGLVNRRKREQAICLSTMTFDGMKNVVS